MNEEKEIERIVKLVAENFHTVGGGKEVAGSLLSVLLADKPMVFVTGVDVEAVVRFVLKKSVLGKELETTCSNN